MIIRARVGLLLLALAGGLAACGGADTADTKAGDDSSSAEAISADKKPAPLGKSDFRTPITEASIRATNPELDDADFAVKWNAATSDAFSFLRAFPPAYHADLAQVAASRTPGGQGICLGDAHPENFGWMTEAGQTFFAANDFDDSGYCPVAFDASRLFVGISLDFADSSLTAEAIAQYVATVGSAKKAVGIESKLAPVWTNVQSSGLSKSTANGHFVLGSATSLSAVDAGTRAALVSWLANESVFASDSLQDVAAYAHDAGGSAELARYWLLLQRGGVSTIVEVKSEVEPAVEWGRHTETLPDSTRFRTLTGAFWPACDADDTFGATLTAPSVAGFYLVRDRLQRASVDFTTLSKKQRTNVVLTEASELAQVHAAAWSGVSASEMTSWLTGTTATMTTRWQNAWKAAHAAQ